MNSSQKKNIAINKIIFIFFLFTLGNLCKASTNIDSLKTIVHNKSSSKSEKHKSFRLIVKYHYQNQLDSAFVYSELAIKNAESSGNTLFRIDSFFD